MVFGISFGSTYKVNNRLNNQDELKKFQKFALNIEDSDKTSLKTRQTYQLKPLKIRTVEHTLMVPDSKDGMVETYCANKGIKFEKLTNDKILRQEAIEKRIKEPKADMKKVYINSDKLELLMARQESNIPHCENDYYEYYSPKVDFMLKSGDKIPATTLEIYSLTSTNDQALEYINKFGKKNLSPEQISVDFSQKTDEPDHCLYFALRDMGIKDIPFYVNQTTYKIADALGIISKKQK